MFYISFVFHIFSHAGLHVLVTYFWTLLQWFHFCRSKLKRSEPMPVNMEFMGLLFYEHSSVFKFAACFECVLGRGPHTHMAANKRHGQVANAFYLQHVLCAKLPGQKVKSSAKRCFRASSSGPPKNIRQLENKICSKREWT